VDAALVVVALSRALLEVGGTPVAVYTPVGRLEMLFAAVVVVLPPPLSCVLAEAPDDAESDHDEEEEEEAGRGAVVIMLTGAVPGTPAMVTRPGSGDCQSDSCS